MPTLDEDLEAIEATYYLALLREAPDKANAELATTWHDVLGRRDPVEIVGHAILWCSRAVIVGAVAECVRMILDPVPRKHRAQVTATLETIERYSRGDASVVDVWRAESEAKSHIVDAVTEAVVNAAEAAGDKVLGFDDEALNSAGCAAFARAWSRRWEQVSPLHEFTPVRTQRVLPQVSMLARLPWALMSHLVRRSIDLAARPEMRCSHTSSHTSNNNGMRRSGLHGLSATQARQP